MATLTSPTLQNLITAVRDLLNQKDRANSFWSDDELARYLNDAVSVYFVEVSHVDEGNFTTTSDLNIVAGTETVALPSDFFELKALYKKSGDSYVPLSFRNRSDETYYTSGAGASDSYYPDFYLRGNSLVLRPIPGTSETAGLKVEYIQFPDTMINGGDSLTSQVSPVFKQLIEMYAVYKAKLKESLVNGNNVHKNAEENLTGLYAQFKQAIALRTHTNTFIKPFNPEE